jgi:hypothetical protein
MSLAKANYQTQLDHQSWIPLAKINHQYQLHPSRMSLAGANQ